MIVRLLKMHFCTMIFDCEKSTEYNWGSDQTCYPPETYIASVEVTKDKPDEDDEDRILNEDATSKASKKKQEEVDIPALQMAANIYRMICDQDSQDSITIIGSDTCNFNFGYINGVHAQLERMLGRPLQRVGCQKHTRMVTLASSVLLF